MSEFKQDDTVKTLVCRQATDEESVIGTGSIGKVTVVGIGLDNGSTDGVEVLFENQYYAHYKPEELSLVPDGTQSENPLEAGPKLPPTMDHAKVIAEMAADYQADQVKFPQGVGIVIKSDRDPSLLGHAGWIVEVLQNGFYLIGTARAGVHRDLIYREDELEEYQPGETKILSKENFKEVADWCGPDTRIGRPWTDKPILYIKTGYSEDPNVRVTVHVGDQIEKLPNGKLQVWVNSDNAAKDDEPVPQEDRPEMLKQSGFNPQARAIALVQTLFYSQPGIELLIEDIYIVWFANTLKNWKALVSTNRKDNAYYEVTYNGEKDETYVDAYHKHVNVKIKSDGLADMTVTDNFLHF